VTFDVHPAEILDGQPRQYLTTLDERVAQLTTTGLDFVLVLRGTADLFAMTANDFAERLIPVLDCRAIVVGANFRFGRGGAGDIATLKAVGAAYGTRATALDLLPALGEPVSSSRIRTEIRVGRVERAAELLGRPLTIVGTVTDRDHERCAVAVPPNLVRPCAGRYDGWLQPGAGSRQHRPALVIVGDRDVDAVLLAGPTPFDARAGDRVRVGFIRTAAGPDDAVSIG
jgi:FAD synthetase